MLLKYCVLAALAAQALVHGKSTTNEQSLNVLPAAKASSKNLAAGLTDKKIIDGLSVKAHVTIKNGKTFESQCGATILDARHILSAAHCFSNAKLAYYVRVGSVLWKTGGQSVRVSNVYTHPKFNHSTLDYDVAVLRLSTDLKLGEAVKAVRLVAANTAVTPDTKITLIGWGYTDPMRSEPLPNNLQETTISTISHTECVDNYGGLTVTDRMFCGMAPPQDSCQGDSGGPAYNAKTGKQLGIISWGMGCSQLAAPGVFVDLANADIQKFITQSLKK